MPQVAQVHLANMKNGTEVIIKVQHPNVKDFFMDDLLLLAEIGAYCNTYPRPLIPSFFFKLCKFTTKKQRAQQLRCSQFQLSWWG